MRRDPTEFRERFKAYKEGKKPYENGLPAYKGGKKPSKFTLSLYGKHRHVIDDTVDYMLGLGIDPILISGILGNMAQESMFDPDSVGPGGFAGTVQMSSDMAKEIKRAYGKVDYKTTNKFIHDAMSDNKIISQPWRNYMKQKGGYYGRTFNTASDAAMAFGRVFERPNEKYANWASRKASAEDALSYVRQRQSNMYSPLDSRDYNYQRAILLGYTPDNTGHWPSRDILTGEYLKSATHPTIMKTVVSDIAEGYNPTYNQNTGKLGSQTWMKPLLPKPVYDFESGEINIPFVDSDEPSYKNGKLPRYGGGLIPYTSSDGTLYNINPNVVESELLNVTTPEIVVTGKDRRPLYQRYDAEHSTYDPNAIRSITDWTPLIGDVGLGLDAYNALSNQNYLQAGLLGGMLLLPNAIEKTGSKIVRFGLKNFPDLTKNLYDIKNLYSPKDNPRLRKYANEMRDLILSGELKERRGRFDPTQAINIDNTPVYFQHGDRLWKFPSKRVGQYSVSFPIPKRYKDNVRGYYHWYPDDVVAIKRSGQSPEEIRNTVYHEMSHASESNIDNLHNLYDDLQPNTHPTYFGKETEKRARVMGTLANMRHYGYDINDPLDIFHAMKDPRIIDRIDYQQLLNFYDFPNNFTKGGGLYTTFLSGYKDGKSPIHIKHPGRLTALKKRTGKSESELYNDGNPAHKKMVVFARNARKWKH